MAAEEFCSFDPFVMIFDGLATAIFIGITKIAFAVDHDEQGLDANVTSTFLEFSKVGGVLSFVLEKLIHILDGLDAEFLFGGGRELEVVQLAREDGAMQRPFGERDFEFGSGGSSKRVRGIYSGEGSATAAR